MIGTAGLPPSAQRFEQKVSLVVLGRDSWLFRAGVLEDFYQLGFAEILCVETAPLKYEPEELLGRFPGLRLLVLQNEVSTGEKINLAALEIHWPRFLVLWDDQKIPEPGLHTKISKFWQDNTMMLLAPELRDSDGKEIPGVLVPSLDGNHLRMLTLPGEEELVETLFTQDFTGLYDREKFLRSGGFDPKIREPYWQRADWGVRCHLWGEAVALGRVFRVDLRTPWVPEDQSARSGSLRFYAKNLALRFSGDHAVLPWDRFGRFWRQSGSTLWACLAEFREVRAWVHSHRYRFVADAKILVESWGSSS